MPDVIVLDDVDDEIQAELDALCETLGYPTRQEQDQT